MTTLSPADQSSHGTYIVGVSHFRLTFLITGLTVSITPKDRQIDKVVTTAIYTLCDYSRGVSFLPSKNHYRYFSKRAYSSENSWSRPVNGHRDYEISISCYKPAKSLLLEHLFSPLTVNINYSGATRQWGRSIVHFCRNAAWDFELQHLIETDRNPVINPGNLITWCNKCTLV